MKNQSDSSPLLPTFLYLCLYNACPQRRDSPLYRNVITLLCDNASPIIHEFNDFPCNTPSSLAARAASVAPSACDCSQPAGHTHQLCQQRSCRTRNTRTDRSSWWFGRTLPLRYGNPQAIETAVESWENAHPSDSIEVWSTMPASATTIFSSSCPTPTGTPY